MTNYSSEISGQIYYFTFKKDKIAMATSLTLQYQDGGKVFKDDVRAIKDALEKLNTTKENTKKDSIRYSVEKFLKS